MQCMSLFSTIYGSATSNHSWEGLVILRKDKWLHQRLTFICLVCILCSSFLHLAYFLNNQNMIFSIAVCIWWIDVSTYEVLEQMFYVLICDFCCRCHALAYPLWYFVIIYLLSGSLPLPWSIRMKIALGAAKGLAFLHEEAERPVIYRDFKTSNILLDAVCSNTLANWSLAHFYHSSNNASLRITMPNFLILDLPKMLQRATRPMFLLVSWEHMVMQLQSMWWQVRLRSQLLLSSYNACPISTWTARSALSDSVCLFKSNLVGC